MEKFGEKLRILRKQHKMSQKRLATEFGIQSDAFISEIETGKRKPSLDFVLKVADLFQVTPNHLLLDNVELDE
jgi:transcriptional regulator with XRE-family HTH domain